MQSILKNLIGGERNDYIWFLRIRNKKIISYVFHFKF